MKNIGYGCGKDIGGWPCGDFLETSEDEDGNVRGQYYYCDECIEKNEKKEQRCKIFKCPICKDVRNKEDDIIAVQCPCGGYMEEVDKNHNLIDKRNEVEKICDTNKCETCPIRGTKCF